MSPERPKALPPAAWAGLCAGGYLAAAAAYLGNAIVLLVGRKGETIAAQMLWVLVIASVIMAVLIAAQKLWVLKVAVVSAGGFAAIHLIGLAFLFFNVQRSTTPLERSLQWQLGTALFFIWLTVLFSALRMVRSHEASQADGDGQ